MHWFIVETRNYDKKQELTSEHFKIVHLLFGKEKMF
jgi:hypothetical protein